MTISTSSFQLQDKVVLLLLTMRAPGNERTVRDKSILTTDADTARLHIGKRLLKCPEQNAISILDGQIRDYITRLALPTPFKSGTHVIPLDLLTMIDGKLLAFQAQRAEAVARFAEVYDVAQRDAQKELGELYRADEYLTADGLQAAHTMDWQYVTLTAPDRMQVMSNEIFEREQKRLQAQWDAAIGDMQEALRVGLAELVEDMVKRLDGDDKKFKPTKLLQRFDEFLTTFDARNVTGDVALAELAAKARAVLAGVDTDSLKKSKELRETVRDTMKQAQETLGQLDITGRSQRRITFDEE